MSRPVFSVDPHGRLANQMIQYLVALKFVDLLGGDCDISGVKLPAWGSTTRRSSPRGLWPPIPASIICNWIRS